MHFLGIVRAAGTYEKAGGGAGPYQLFAYKG